MKISECFLFFAGRHFLSAEELGRFCEISGIAGENKKKLAAMLAKLGATNGRVRWSDGSESVVFYGLVFSTSSLATQCEDGSNRYFYDVLK